MPSPKRRVARGPEPAVRRFVPWLVGGAAVVVVGVIAFVALTAGPGRIGWTEQGRDGSWTDVSADELATMLAGKDFTLIDVKTPYVGEIPGTDLWIPYDQVVARAADLPADKSTKVLVYCRSGGESRVAAQALLDLGFTNVWNLDGGMQAWQASGREIVQKPRS